MMKASEKWGVDVDTAVELALQELKLTRDEVNVEILEESSKGFLGIGSKLAKVRVTPKNDGADKAHKEKATFDDIDRILAGLPENNTVVVPDEIRKDYDKYEEEELEDARASERARQGEKRKSSRPKKNRERSKKNHGNFEATLLLDVDKLTPVQDHPVEAFLKEITKEMGIDLDFEVKEGKDLTIIGKRGQTLDAVQYLASLVVNKENGGYTRVVMDAENYRAKREQTLVSLANRLAGKVERSERKLTLEPMNPYERKVIHSTLQNHPSVTTRSEGKDPYRRVIIEKK